MNRLHNLNTNFMKKNLIQKNIYYQFFNLIENNSNHVLLKQKENNQWVSYTNKKLYNMIQDCRLFLNQNYINQGDHIIYKGKNSVDWFVWNMATLSLGGVWIPIYHNQNLNYIKHVVNDSKPRLIIHDDPNFPLKDFDKYHVHKSDISENKNYFNNDIIHNDLSHLIYTSGTSGKPKGVKLTHLNLLSNIDSINTRFTDLKERENLKTLNILPWAHIYSLNAELYYNILNQNTIYLSSGPDNLLKEIYEVKPDVIYLVPRVMEEIHKKLGFLEKPLLDKLIPYILKKIFGKDLITVFIGGAKLHVNDAKFFMNNNINICEGYGTTEASPMISVNHMKDPRDINSIGAILDNVDIKIINGEICVSGKNVTSGYYNNEEKNKESFIYENNKRYYKTGDAGSIKDNFLYYEGRISNNYKLSNGKFIEAEYFEKKINHLFKNPFIIYGNNKNFNIIITENNIDSELINKINEIIPKYAHVQKILSLDEKSFSNFLTPKMSLKRKELINYYQDEIEEIYK